MTDSTAEDAYIQQVVQSAPPLPDELVAELRRLLPPVEDATAGNGDGPKLPSPGPSNLNADTTPASPPQNQKGARRVPQVT